ncbi:MAG: diacylglycerol kinase family protein [Clostridia bacterium]
MSSEIKVVEKSKKLINSFKYAIQGILSSFKTERNMKIHIFIMILVIIAGVILKINKYEWIACILCFAIVISGELFNTAIETVVDMVMPYKNDKAKIAKDIAAGAVLTLAIGAAVIGVIIFVPKIF